MAPTAARSWLAGTVSGAAYGAVMGERWRGDLHTEGQIFALLSYVIGPGQHDLCARIGSGKSSVRQKCVPGMAVCIALVGQDNVRRVVLRERDVPTGRNIGLIDTVARYALPVN